MYSHKIPSHYVLSLNIPFYAEQKRCCQTPNNSDSIHVIQTHRKHNKKTQSLISEGKQSTHIHKNLYLHTKYIGQTHYGLYAIQTLLPECCRTTSPVWKDKINVTFKNFWVGTMRM